MILMSIKKDLNRLDGLYSKLMDTTSPKLPMLWRSAETLKIAHKSYWLKHLKANILRTSKINWIGMANPSQARLLSITLNHYKPKTLLISLQKSLSILIHPQGLNLDYKIWTTLQNPRYPPERLMGRH